MPKTQADFLYEYGEAFAALFTGHNPMDALGSDNPNANTFDEIERRGRAGEIDFLGDDAVDESSALMPKGEYEAVHGEGSYPDRASLPENVQLREERMARQRAEAEGAGVNHEGHPAIQPPAKQVATMDDAAIEAALWKGLKDRYGDVDEAGVLHAVSAMRSEGMQFDSVDGFYSEISARAGLRAQQPNRPTPQPAPQPRARQQTADADDDSDDGRTAGIFGGTESGGKPSRSAPAKEDPNEFVNDLKAWQAEHRLY